MTDRLAEEIARPVPVGPAPSPAAEVESLEHDLGEAYHTLAVKSAAFVIARSEHAEAASRVAMLMDQVQVAREKHSV